MLVLNSLLVTLAKHNVILYDSFTQVLFYLLFTVNRKRL